MGTTNYIWHRNAVIAETDDQNAVTATYARDPERFSNLISQTRGGQTHYHHYNALGSTTELTDSAGTVTDSFRHSAFGDEVQRTGSTQTPYTWVGRTGYQQDEAERFYLQLRALAVCGYAWIPG